MKTYGNMGLGRKTFQNKFKISISLSGWKDILSMFYFIYFLYRFEQWDKECMSRNPEILALKFLKFRLIYTPVYNFTEDIYKYSKFMYKEKWYELL